MPGPGVFFFISNSKFDIVFACIEIPGLSRIVEGKVYVPGAGTFPAFLPRFSRLLDPIFHADAD